MAVIACGSLPHTVVQSSVRRCAFWGFLGGMGDSTSFATILKLELTLKDQPVFLVKYLLINSSVQFYLFYNLRRLTFMFKMKVTYSWHVLPALRALEIVSCSLFTL